RCIDLPQVRTYGLQVLIGHKSRGAAYHMDNAPLDQRHGKNVEDSRFKAFEAIHAAEQDGLYASPTQILQDQAPLAGAFAFRDIESQNIPIPMRIDPIDGVYRALDGLPFFPGAIMDGIQIDDRITSIQGPLLPFRDLVIDLVCDRRDHALAQLQTVDLMHLLADIGYRVPARIKADNRIVQAGVQLPAALRHQDRLVCA